MAKKTANQTEGKMTDELRAAAHQVVGEKAQMDVAGLADEN
jgi:hypothetical protein